MVPAGDFSLVSQWGRRGQLHECVLLSSSGRVPIEVVRTLPSERSVGSHRRREPFASAFEALLLGRLVSHGLLGTRCPPPPFLSGSPSVRGRREPSEVLVALLLVGKGRDPNEVFVSLPLPDGDTS